MTDKEKQYQKTWRDKNREKVNQKNRDSYQRNKTNRRATHKAYIQSRPEVRMICAARFRAKTDGVPCTITVDDIAIPEVCPVLGITLKINTDKADANSPSLDRFIPQLGYVAGNVRVISNRANTLKRDASLEELQAIVAWMTTCS